MLTGPLRYKRLQEEISQADSEDPTLSYNPQNLKYLDAVIREGLRMGMSTPTRIPRVVPQNGWSFAGFYLPAGTVVGCQLHTLHFNPSTFPEPFAFKPERWLDPTPEMQRDWIPFSLGARRCLARDLAQFELLLAVREVVRQDLLGGARAIGGELKMYEWFNSKLIRERLELVW
jgi:cytochrome P450